ncbi:L-fuculose phosphate aldolase [Castellaniella defragrans]
MKTDSLSKDTIVNNVIEQMNAGGLQIDPISVPKALASAAHILFMLGHTTESGLAGQVSARGEDPETFWTQQWGTGFEEATEDNLLLVDGDLTVLKGKGMANPAARFHSWTYKNHPHVKCILHAHPLHVSALSMLEIPLIVSHMDTCVLHDEVAFVEKWPGIPVGNSEGKLISAALANKKAILLAHHGMLSPAAPSKRPASSPSCSNAPPSCNSWHAPPGTSNPSPTIWPRKPASGSAPPKGIERPLRTTPGWRKGRSPG